MPTETQFRTIDGIDESIYQHLQCRAKAILRHEDFLPLMEPADLVHEAFLRIAGRKAPALFHDAAHLMAVATIVMRHILVDCSRAASSPARHRWVPIDSEMFLAVDTSSDTLPVREILHRMAAMDRRLFAVVEMRFYSGLAIDEIAAALSVSSRTVKRDWKTARTWLRKELARDSKRVCFGTRAFRRSSSNRPG